MIQREGMMTASLLRPILQTVRLFFPAGPRKHFSGVVSHCFSHLKDLAFPT